MGLERSLGLGHPCSLIPTFHLILDHQVDPLFLASLVVTMTGFQVAWELAQVPTSDFQDPDLILQVLTSPNFLLEGEAEDLLVEAWEEVLGVVLGVVLEDSCKGISL